MKLIIRNKIINTPLIEIIESIKKDTIYCQEFREMRENIVVACPFHKNGQERHPSCFINSSNDKDIPFGTYHCWSCGASGSLVSFVSKCKNCDTFIAEEWLCNSFSDIFADFIEEEPPLEKEKKTYLDMNVLNNFDYSNSVALDYLINKRHLNKKVIDFFYIGCNRNNNSITFPLWDENGNLVGISERNIFTKWFEIPEIYPKPVYLLNAIKKFNYQTVYVAESQINALTLWGWGYPAIAMLGTGSEVQYEKLKKSGVRHFILCFDGDLAGDKALQRFKFHMDDSVILSYKKIPRGKDVNDMSKDEFDSLMIEEI